MTKNAISMQLNLLLLPLGFDGKKDTWNRRIGSVVEVIKFQISKTGDTATVNACILDCDAYMTLWGVKQPEFIKQPNCTVGVRIGELIDDRDKWWPLGDRGTAVEIAAHVGTVVLPFLERMHSRKAMEQWLVDAEVTKRKYPPPILNLAILKSLQGDSVQGCELIVEFQRRSLGAWRARAAEVAARLGCV